MKIAVEQESLDDYFKRVQLHQLRIAIKAMADKIKELEERHIVDRDAINVLLRTNGYAQLDNEVKRK